MSNLYNMNRLLLINDIEIVPWSGKTLSQITTIVKKNTNTGQNIFKSNPIKLHRRIITTNRDLTYCGTRSAVTIEELSRPGSSIIHETVVNGYLDNFITIKKKEIQNDNNDFETPGDCAPCIDIGSTTGSYGKNAVYGFNPVQNALKRVRSGSILKKQYDISYDASFNKAPQYYTNNIQYLHSRNKRQQQNEFSYLTRGVNAENETYFYSKNQRQQNQVCDNSGTIVYYNPSNPQFAEQGSVTSSSYISRKKYDTITHGQELLIEDNGIKIQNALAYGVTENGYTNKHIMGYPMTKTPYINPYMEKDESKCCK